MVCRYRKDKRSQYTSYGQGHEHHTIKLLTIDVDIILHILSKNTNKKAFSVLNAMNLLLKVDHV
jgi:hypothetical protein